MNTVQIKLIDSFAADESEILPCVPKPNFNHGINHGEDIAHQYSIAMLVFCQIEKLKVAKQKIKGSLT